MNFRILQYKKIYRQKNSKLILKSDYLSSISNMRLNYKFYIMVFSLSVLKIASQHKIFYENKNYILLNAGILLNHPTQQRKIDGVKRLASLDPNFSISLFTFSVNKKHGWQYRVSGGTQSVRFKIKNKDGFYSTRNAYSSGDGNYSLNINKTYNFNLSKKINTIISFGPILFLNRYTNSSDSSKQVVYSDYVAYNVKPFGFGFYAAINTVFFATPKTKFIFSLSYQRGFVLYREARVSDLSRLNETVFNYYGSGASAMIGLLFNIAAKYKTTSSTLK